MVLGLLLLAAVAADDSIHVDRRAATTQVVEFDPGHQPVDVPKLGRGEDALTRMLFNCTVKLKYDVIDKRRADGKWRVTARLREIRFTLDLTNTIFLPKGSSGKLRAHEEGHAQINGIIYEDAEPAARDVALDAMQRDWEGSAETIDAAGKAATNRAVDWICKEYLKRTADKAFRVGEIYDKITRHGSNARKVSDAIEEAIRKQALEER